MALGRGLVWMQGTRTFRVAEDGSFADPEDSPLVLGESLVFLLHPLNQDPGLLACWRKLFEDYEILSPFPQLNREVFEKIPEVRSWEVSIGGIFGFLKAGWKREYSGGGLWGLKRKLPAGEATLVFLASVELQGASPLERVGLAGLRLEGHFNARERSELLREVWIYAGRPLI
jgi:hypothetical protein